MPGFGVDPTRAVRGSRKVLWNEFGFDTRSDLLEQKGSESVAVRRPKARQM